MVGVFISGMILATLLTSASRVKEAIKKFRESGGEKDQDVEENLFLEVHVLHQSRNASLPPVGLVLPSTTKRKYSTSCFLSFLQLSFLHQLQQELLFLEDG